MPVGLVKILDPKAHACQCVECQPQTVAKLKLEAKSECIAELEKKELEGIRKRIQAENEAPLQSKLNKRIRNELYADLNWRRWMGCVHYRSASNLRGRRFFLCRGDCGGGLPSQLNRWIAHWLFRG